MFNINMKLAVEAFSLTALATLMAVGLTFGVTISSMYANGDQRLVQAHTVPQVLASAMDRIKEMQDEWDNEYSLTPR